jgi:ATP-dependent exoDNAse (exonuclease V) beta subunit
LQCGLKGYWTYIEPQPQEKHEDLEKGNILHKYYETFYKHLDEHFNINVAEEKALKELNIDVDFQEKYMKHALNFREFNIITKRRPLFTEQKLFYKDWNGIIDRVDLINEERKEVIIIDYKTSNGELNEIQKEIKTMNVEGKVYIKKSERLPQPLLYAKLFKENYPDYKVIGVGILFTGNQSEIAFKEITDEEIEENWKELNKQKEQAMEIINNKKFDPKKSFGCRWCGFQSICPLFKFE